MDVMIRRAEQDDTPQILALTKTAFDRDVEAKIVADIESAGESILALVAVRGQVIVGHVLFSPATVVGKTTHAIVALGPISVQPGLQREGIGSTLIRNGLEMLRDEGHSVVMLLGHSDYYPRFGFERADTHDIRLSFDVPAPAFMVYEIQPNVLNDISGTAYFHPAFG